MVSPAYQVRTEDGVLVDESPVSAPLDYLHGHGSLISGLKRRWKVMKLATNLMSLLARTTLTVSTTKTLVQRVPKDVFMGVDELQVGMRFLG